MYIFGSVVMDFYEYDDFFVENECDLDGMKIRICIVFKCVGNLWFIGELYDISFFVC